MKTNKLPVNCSLTHSHGWDSCIHRISHSRSKVYCSHSNHDRIPDGRIHVRNHVRNHARSRMSYHSRSVYRIRIHGDHIREHRGHIHDRHSHTYSQTTTTIRCTVVVVVFHTVDGTQESVGWYTISKPNFVSICQWWNLFNIHWDWLYNQNTKVFVNICKKIILQMSFYFDVLLPLIIKVSGYVSSLNTT